MFSFSLGLLLMENESLFYPGEYFIDVDEDLWRLTFLSYLGYPSVNVCSGKKVLVSLGPRVRH